MVALPQWITIDPGGTCNLKCVQCPREDPNRPYIDHPVDPLVVTQVEDALPYLQRLQILSLSEPLLSDTFWHFVEHPSAKHLSNLDTSTNGTLLSPRNVERLLASSLRTLHISIDGATETTYKRIRGGNLAKIKNGITRLTRRRKEVGRSDIVFVVVMTLMKENIRELPLMMDLASEVGVERVWAQHLVVKGEGFNENWKIQRDGWQFDYEDQCLSHAPGLSNEMVRAASARAQELGVIFDLDPNLWLRE